jgi:hypothetical protein
MANNIIRCRQPPSVGRGLKGQPCRRVDISQLHAVIEHFRDLKKVHRMVKEISVPVIVFIATPVAAG